MLRLRRVFQLSGNVLLLSRHDEEALCRGLRLEITCECRKLSLNLKYLTRDMLEQAYVGAVKLVIKELDYRMIILEIY